MPPQTTPVFPDVALTLTDADVAFVEAGVSILAAAAGPDRQPVMARAVGARVEPGTGRIRLSLRTTDAAALLAGALASGRVAVMFSRPSTNETIQIKGDAPAVEQPAAEDEATRRRYLPRIIADLMPLGFTPEFVGCVGSDHGSPMAVLSFAPKLLFDQTPGPQAGRAREPAR